MISNTSLGRCMKQKKTENEYNEKEEMTSSSSDWKRPLCQNQEKRRLKD
jgi:hypothetical protein